MCSIGIGPSPNRLNPNLLDPLINLYRPNGHKHPENTKHTLFGDTATLVCRSTDLMGDLKNGLWPDGHTHTRNGPFTLLFLKKYLVSFLCQKFATLGPFGGGVHFPSCLLLKTEPLFLRLLFPIPYPPNNQTSTRIQRFTDQLQANE